MCPLIILLHISTWAWKDLKEGILYSLIREAKISLHIWAVRWVVENRYIIVYGKNICQKIKGKKNYSGNWECNLGNKTF